MNLANRELSLYFNKNGDDLEDEVEECLLNIVEGACNKPLWIG